MRYLQKIGRKNVCHEGTVIMSENDFRSFVCREGCVSRNIYQIIKNSVIICIDCYNIEEGIGALICIFIHRSGSNGFQKGTL